MNDEIIKLAREYTQETADLKDYQCQARSAIFGRLLARVCIKNDECITGKPSEMTFFPKAIEIEECDPHDPTEYIWALVPEYNSFGHAKVVLRRVGTTDGELILSRAKRAVTRLKMTDREEKMARRNILKGIVPKIRNYEAQIKTERARLNEQIKKDDKVYMEACAVELKRICDRMKEDLEDFLDIMVNA